MERFQSLKVLNKQPLRWLMIVLCYLTFSVTGINNVWAQQGYRIQGSTVDTALHSKMFNSTIYVLNAKDSILSKFDYAKADGTFSIDDLPSGNFILLITYPDYADYVEPFTLGEAHTMHNFGTVSMQLKSRLLHEVIIKSAVTAIKIKGDTTEFNARAYVIQPNDKVEDLLKQLPGLQVDKNGKITANGERVTKVLLDGEEFFGDDPTLVTKNIRADMVDKIQLFDKKSDQAVFTGVDDGVKTKTINVKLRADKNTGVFGKAEAGLATKSIYQAQVLYNHFKPGEKYAAYGTAANNGRISLGIGDNNKLGAASNTVQIGDVIIAPAATDDQDGFNGTYNGRGLPVARTGGIHYDHKWNDTKENMNANYKAGYLGVTGSGTTLTEQNLTNATINSNTNRSFDNSAFRQKLDAEYQVKPDTSSNLKIAADGTFKHTTTKTSSFSNTFQNTTLLNQNTQRQDNNGTLSIFDASAFYTKKLTGGRSFSWSVSEAYNRNKTTGYQNSIINFYNAAGGTDSTQRIDQYKITVLSSSILSSNITYSQPLSKTLSLVFNYGLGLNKSNADRRSYNAPAPQQYNKLDTVYSNDYRFNQLTNQLGAIFTYHMGKTLINFGTKTSTVAFKQVNVFKNNIYRRDFVNWAPQLNYQYRPSQQKSFSFSYNGNTVQPSIDQVQPVAVNTDPLNVTIGNPGLQPAFSNRFSTRYRFYQPISGRLINFSGSYGFTSNPVINSSVTGANGKTVIQYTNLAEYRPYNYSLSTDLGFNIKPVDLNLNIELMATGNQGYSSINNTLVKSENYTYWGSVQLQKNVQKKYSFSVVAGPSYTINRFSIQQRNNDAAGFYGELFNLFFLPAKLQVSSNISYNYTAATQTFTAQNRTIWNASLSRTFLKNDNLKFLLSANDLLNQNVNFSRGISANTITQSSSTSIRRYIMLSITWDFTKFDTNPVKK